MIPPGECFLVKHAASGVHHLWVVVSWPDAYDTVLLVNITDADNTHDGSCQLNAGDHPFIRKPSHAYYAGAKVSRVQGLEEHLQNGEIIQKEFASARCLKKIQAGVKSSNSLPFGYHYFRELMTDDRPSPETVKQMTPKKPKIKVVVPNRH